MTTLVAHTFDLRRCQSTMAGSILCMSDHDRYLCHILSTMKCDQYIRDTWHFCFKIGLSSVKEAMVLVWTQSPIWFDHLGRGGSWRAWTQFPIIRTDTKIFHHLSSDLAPHQILTTIWLFPLYPFSSVGLRPSYPFLCSMLLRNKLMWSNRVNQKVTRRGGWGGSNVLKNFSRLAR